MSPKSNAHVHGKNSFHKGESEYTKLKRQLTNIKKHRAYLELLDQQENSKNADFVFSSKLKVNFDLKTAQNMLVNNAKHKFKYIMGHRKDEIRPGVLAEEDKFLKNITKCIIVPSERISNCDDGIEKLHA